MTTIEWVRNPGGSQGITVNSKTGCRNHTSEGLCLGGLFPCYARKLAQGRLKQRYLANMNFPILAMNLDPRIIPFYPRWWPERLEQIRKIKKPTGIFLDDMSDWMGDYWPEEWTRQELQVMRDCPQHRFYTLTKQSQNLFQFSPFPENCFVGVTATNQDMFGKAILHLADIQASVKFISLEPLLERIDISHWIGYNAEYESKKLRGNSLQSSVSGGIRDRQRGEDLENQIPDVRQMEGGKQDNSLQTTQGRERHGEISPGENHDEREEVSCSRQQIGMASLQRDNTNGIDSQPQERGRKGQSSREFRAFDLQPTDQTFDKCIGQNIQTGQTRQISLLIIGACTGTWHDILQLSLRYPQLTMMQLNKRLYTLQPRIGDLREIVEAADKAEIPVFLKDNLDPLLRTVDGQIPTGLCDNYGHTLRQEMPAIK